MFYILQIFLYYSIQGVEAWNQKRKSAPESIAVFYAWNLEYILKKDRTFKAWCIFLKKR